MLQGNRDHHRCVRQQGVDQRALFASRQKQLTRPAVLWIESDCRREGLTGDC
jgi:hypothetical protein